MLAPFYLLLGILLIGISGGSLSKLLVLKYIIIHQGKLKIVIS